MRVQYLPPTDVLGDAIRTPDARLSANTVRHVANAADATMVPSAPPKHAVHGRRYTRPVDAEPLRASAGLPAKARAQLGSNARYTPAALRKVPTVSALTSTNARRRLWLCFALCVLCMWVATVPVRVARSSPGALVLVGGGPTPAQVFERTLALSGGSRAVVAVLPHTFPSDTIGDSAVAMWATFHPREVIKVSRTDSSAAVAALERATLIWIPGGFPSYFMDTVRDTPIPDVIRACFAAGVTIGGASAGAVAMSRTMLADESTPDGTRIDGPPTVDGLGLWPEAIVSPHFTERRRLGPLIPVVQDHPALFGVGIDEGTAAIVSRGQIEVLGRGTVVIVDARGTRPRTLKAGTRMHYRIGTE